MGIWICVRAEFDSHREDWSLIHEIFAAHGCGGTVEHGFPPSMSAYVYEDAKAKEVIDSLHKTLVAAGAACVTEEVVQEEDWAEAWKSFFKPRAIGDAFMIAPTWDIPQDTDGRELIVLDPGQAFGTGDHPTTRLCIALLEQEVGPGATVADVGTGSGILAIVAKKLGADEVYATEIDAAACDAARINFERNRVDVALWNTADIPDEIPECDVVVSNLVSAIIVRKAGDIAQIVGEGGVWIFSGVIPDNLPDVQSAAERAGFVLESWLREEGWVAGKFVIPE